jgi:hypothetical protein
MRIPATIYVLALGAVALVAHLIRDDTFRIFISRRDGRQWFSTELRLLTFPTPAAAVYAPLTEAHFLRY